MHRSNLTREQAFELLKKYNKDPFHIRHSLTMEGVMRWYACNLGFEDEADYWSQVGLLHDIDFENWPEEHCKKAPELLKEGGCADDMLMEKVLFAADELSGLIWSASLMRPSKSVQDMEVKSVRKKYKDLKFAAGCSREVINTGAERLGWELDKLIQMTLDAMRSCERSVEDYMAANY